jgi:hypothetical protein
MSNLKGSVSPKDQVNVDQSSGETQSMGHEHDIYGKGFVMHDVEQSHSEHDIYGKGFVMHDIEQSQSEHDIYGKGFVMNESDQSQSEQKKTGKYKKAGSTENFGANLGQEKQGSRPKAK